MVLTVTSPSFLMYNLYKKIKIKKGNKNNRKEMNTVEYKEENQPWAARCSSGCELSRHSAKTVWATESRGTVRCKMSSGNVVEIHGAGDGCVAPKGTWREIEASLDPEWRSVFNRGASFSDLGQISAVCDFSMLWGRFQLFGLLVFQQGRRPNPPGSPQSSQEPVCLPAVVPGTKAEINNVVERKKRGGKGEEGRKTGQRE